MTRSGAGEALRLSDVVKVYGSAEGAGAPVTALDGVSLSLAAGTFTSVMGPSGSGKSTLLQCAAGLDRPTSGRVLVGGAELPGGGESELTRFRRSRIGFVFQHYNLVPYLTVAQNVTLPQTLTGRRGRRAAAEAAAVLERLGIGDLAQRRPAELSGGQQQRVAIARALATRPAVLFADEPTGALDTASGRQVLRLLRESADAFGQTVVMVTHDPVAAAFADTVLFLADGRLVDELRTPDAAETARRLAALDSRARDGGGRGGPGGGAGGGRGGDPGWGGPAAGPRTAGARTADPCTADPRTGAARAAGLPVPDDAVARTAAARAGSAPAAVRTGRTEVA